jgi:AAA ATPase domain/Bacterial transcriptional activator domain
VAAGTFAILGRVELLCGERPAELRRQLRKALALMVAASGKRVRRQEISTAVWGDEDRDVRTLMWSLRRVLRECNSGFDVPPDKGKEGHYRLVMTGVTTGPGALEEAVDAFRFLALTREAEELVKGGAEPAAVELLAAAAGLWGGEPFADLWPHGQPEACRRLTADLEHARDFLVRTLAETALRAGAPYRAARAALGRPVGVPAQDRDAAWLAGFLIALHDGPGTDEAERLLAARHGAARGLDRHAGDGVVTRADDLILLAQAGIDVHRPLTVTPRPPVTGSPPVVVGREAELAALRHLVTAARGGRPAVVAARGASGRGKTRLAEELAASAVAAGVPVVLIGAGQPGDLRPWQELAERLWPAACRDIGAGQGRAAPLTLGQRRALIDFVAPRPGASAAPDPDQAQQVRFAEIARALAVLARHVAVRRGLVVALDDADRLTGRGRELLGLLLDGLRDAPVGIALLGRDDGDGADSWTAAVTAARAETVGLRLAPLPDEAIGSWLRQLLGRTPADADVRRIAAATGGEPVRIRDQLAAVAEQHALAARASGASAGTAVPSAWLAAAAITAADLAIDTALVARMLDLSSAAADQEELRARRVAYIDTSAGVRFSHGSHRDEVTAWLDADPALRRDLHQRAFAALTERAPDLKTGATADPDPRLPVRIAGHALGADRDLPAGEAARAFLAAARAERVSGEAAEAWARAGIERDPDDPEIRASLHLALGDALDQRGCVTEADREYQLAHDIADGHPVARAEALIRLARRWTDPGKIDWYLLHGLRDGIAALAGHDEETAVALRVRLTAHLARKSTLAIPVLGTEADDIRRNGIALARAALGQADALPPADACEVLNESRWALYDYDPPAKTIQLSQRLDRAGLLARSPYFQSQGLMTLAIDQLRLGQLTDAQGTLLAHERTRPASHASQWLQLTMETVLDLWHGRFGAAEARLLTVAAPIVARAHAEGSQVADTLQQTWQGQVYWLRRERGELIGETDPELLRQIEGHAFFPIWRAGLALIRCDEGDLPGAAAHLRALDAEYQGFAAFPPHGWTVSVAALLAEVCLALSPAGRPGGTDDPLGGLLQDVTARLRAILGAHAGEFVLAGWPSVLFGPAERYSGLLAAAAGDFEEALQLFDAASAAVAGAPPQAARLRADKARALIRLAQAGGGRADLAAAARLLTEAAAAADRLGMRALAAQARELLAEC